MAGNGATSEAVIGRIPQVARRRADSLVGEALHRFRRHRLAMIGTVILAAMVVAVVAGPFVYRVPIDEIDFRAKLKTPSATHPLGTDDLGQDILARMLYGGRISLAVGVVAMLISVGVGTALFYDPFACRRINEGIAAYLREHGFASVQALSGSLDTSREPQRGVC